MKCIKAISSYLSLYINTSILYHLVLMLTIEHKFYNFFKTFLPYFSCFPLGISHFEYLARHNSFTMTSAYLDVGNFIIKAFGKKRKGKLRQSGDPTKGSISVRRLCKSRSHISSITRCANPIHDSHPLLAHLEEFLCYIRLLLQTYSHK